jgi:hypothetical protein
MFGRVDLDAQITIPFKYESLSNNYNKKPIIAKKDGKFGIIDKDDSILLPFVYDSLFCENPGSIIYSLNGKFGVYSASFETIIPANYDKISNCAGPKEGHDTYGLFYSDVFFYVTKNGLNGMYKANEGEKIPCIYHSIHPVWAILNKDVQIIDYYMFTLGDSKTKSGATPYGYLNEAGLEITPPMDEYMGMVYFHKKERGHFAAKYIIARSDKGMWVYNMADGQKSDVFKGIYQMPGGIAFVSDNNWGLLDSNLQIGKTYKKNWPESSQYNRENFPVLNEVHSSSDNASAFQENWYKHGLIPLTIHKQGEDKKEGYEITKHGLFNPKSGKTIQPVYDHVFPKAVNGELFTWMIEFNKDYSITKIDIYNDKFKRIKRLNTIAHIMSDELDETSMVLVKNDSDKIGGLSFSGETILPFEYGWVERKKGFLKSEYTDNESFYLLRTAKKVGLFDSHGKQLIPCQYKWIALNNNGTITINEDDKLQLLSNNLTVIFKNFDRTFSGYRVDSNNLYIPQIDYPQRNQYTDYFIKDSVIYSYNNGSVNRVDSTKIKFTAEYCILKAVWNMQFLIDKTGKIKIDKKGYNIEETEHGYFVSHGKKNWFKYDKHGDLIEQSKAPKKTSYYSGGYKPKPSNDWNNGYYGIKTDEAVFYWKGAANRWTLIDSLKKQHYDFTFAYPVFNWHGNSAVFQSQGKFGAFGKDMNIILEPKYDFIYQHGELFLYKLNEKWGVYSRHSDSLISPIYDEITAATFNNNFMVFKDNKMGVFNSALETVLPLTDTTKIIEDHNLAELIGIPSSNGFNTGLPNLSGFYVSLMVNNKHNNYTVFAQTDEIDFYRKLNNIHFVEAAHTYSTNNMILEVSNCDVPKALKHKNYQANRKHRLNKTQAIKQRYTVLHNDNYYAEDLSTVYSSLYVFSKSQEWDCGNYISTDSVRHSFDNYQIINNELVPITLFDVLKDDQNSREKLDNLLLEELNKTQYLGPGCAILDFYLKQMTEDYSLNETGIYFYLSLNGDYSHNLFLSYESLTSLLRFPNYFDLKE